MNEFQKEFLEESSCMACKQIPLMAKECYNCNKLICFVCDLKSNYNQGIKLANKTCLHCKSEGLVKTKIVNSSSSINSDMFETD